MKYLDIKYSVSLSAAVHGRPTTVWKVGKLYSVLSTANGVRAVVITEDGQFQEMTLSAIQIPTPEELLGDLEDEDE